jgi:aspartate-semialdehyde dehydrogenase
LHDLAPIKRVVVSTYQSVSGAGKAGDGRAVQPDPRHLRQRAGVEPSEEVHQADRLQRHSAHRPFMDDGSTKEEWKMAVETRKILDPDIQVTATCVRVPVFIGHAEAVNVEFEHPISVEEARRALRAAPGVSRCRPPGRRGLRHAGRVPGEDFVYVSRLRKDPTVANGLNLLVVADNLRKGAALNAVQIAEEAAGRRQKAAAALPTWP